VCHSTVLVFSFFSKPSRGNIRQIVLETYELRAKLSRGKQLMPAYALLFAGLRKTGHLHICVSVFITELGTFTVFSDFGGDELIGALFEPGAPEETPVFSHLFMNGELLSRERE
jgi:hypothetical protein